MIQEDRSVALEGFREVEMVRYYKDANAKMLGGQYDVARRRRVICRAGSWH